MARTFVGFAGDARDRHRPATGTQHHHHHHHKDHNHRPHQDRHHLRHHHVPRRLAAAATRWLRAHLRVLISLCVIAATLALLLLLLRPPHYFAAFPRLSLTALRRSPRRRPGDKPPTGPPPLAGDRPDNHYGGGAADLGPSARRSGPDLPRGSTFARSIELQSDERAFVARERAAWTAYMRAVPDYDPAALGIVRGSRGVVLTGPGKSVASIITAVTLLRETGCTLPVQFSYLRAEVSDQELETV
ncbi:hypothetical protein HK405_014109, partial [Cladochytrium tenue]